MFFHEYEGKWVGSCHRRLANFGCQLRRKHPYLTIIQIMLYQKYALQESLRELVKIIQI